EAQAPWCSPRGWSRLRLTRPARARYDVDMQARDHRYLSEEEFLALPDGTERLELFDGEVVVSPSVTPRHQAVLAALYDAVRDHVGHAQARGRVFFAPLDLRVGDGRIFQPDLMLFAEPVPDD